MSIFQRLGLNRCQPIYQSHTLPNAFTKSTPLCSALQQYVDSFTATEIDEHWLMLRDRYQGQDWTKEGLLQKFEDCANGLGMNLQMEFVKTGDCRNIVDRWKRSTLNEFRNREVAVDFPMWETANEDQIVVGKLRVKRGYFEVAAQFKFLWIAGGIKSKKIEFYLRGLKVSHGL